MADLLMTAACSLAVSIAFVVGWYLGHRV